MDWNQFRNAMDALEGQIKTVNCQVAPTVKHKLAAFREKLLEEQTNYALGSAAYIKRLDELFERLHQEGCLIPRGSEGDATTYFDELVRHAMIAGTYDVLEKWGVQPFSIVGVQALLGHPRDLFVQVFEYKAYEAPASEVPPAARPYYEYLAQTFSKSLSD